MDNSRVQTGLILLVLVIFFCALSSAEEQSEIPDILKQAKKLAMTGQFSKGSCEIWILEIPAPQADYYLTYCETHKTIQLVESLDILAVALVYEEKIRRFFRILIMFGRVIEREPIGEKLGLEVANEFMAKVQSILKAKIAI